MKAIPTSVREAAVAAYLSGKGTAAAIAAEFGITEPSLHRFVRIARRGDNLEPKHAAGWAPRRTAKEHENVLIAYIASHPQATADEVRDYWAHETGTTVSTIKLLRTLHELGIWRERQTPWDTPPSDKGPRRYGYGPRHRREKLEIRYASSLTDVEWEIIGDLFENDGPGRPPVHGRREIMDAICYVVRSGCPWRMLPKEFPAWQAVYALFRRWAAQGRFEAMHDRLRSLWRMRVGRSPNPTAAVIDSQSVKTAEKGGSSVTMQPRK